MTQTKNTRRGAGTPRRAAETAAFGKAAISCNYSTTAPADRQPGFIENLLLYGPENGQTLQDLVHITQWPERAIRKEIEAERRACALIISDNQHGYFLTDDPAEAQRFARSMHHRAAQIRQTATAVEKAAGLTQCESKPLEGQEALF